MRRALLPIAMLAALVAGCGSERQSSVAVIVLPSDPKAGATLRAATTEGLVAVDAQGRIVPALADRWIVTDDGQSYIFRLRDGTWADGSPLSGESARAALRQALREARKGPLKAEIEAIDEIRAMAGRVIEIRLNRPSPDLLQLLAHPAFGLERGGKGVGPMARENSNDAIVLTPLPPESRGQVAIEDWAENVRTIELSTAQGKEAVERFSAGTADVVLGGTYNEWPAVFGSSLPGAAIQVDRAVGLFGLVMAHSDGFLEEPENREAIAMAIDRTALAEALREPGWVPTTRIVTPGTQSDAGLVAERWTGLSLEQRRAIATSRVARWQGARGPVTLRIAMPTGSGADLVFDRVAADLRSVGFTVKRVAANAAADLKLIDEVAVYNRPAWFLTRLSCLARPGTCSPAADARFREAQAVADAQARNLALAEAEAQMAADNVFVPFGPPLRWMLVGPGIPGISTNALALHPLLPLALPPAN
jgi:ABC-type transport system substrate-binding protein